MHTRRLFLQGAAAAAVAQSVSAQAKPLLIGVGSAAHQVEGNNINSDMWLAEHIAPMVFPDKSGDSIDHYHRFESDIVLLAKLGFKGFRFSVEWARVEPERNEFSLATLAHYRRVAEVCRANGIAPMITLHHFTMPLWLAKSGGWEKPESAGLFARYCGKVAQTMGDLPLGYCTINEINIPPYVQRMASRMPALAQLRQLMASGAKSPEFSTLLFGDAAKTAANLMEAHAQSMAAIHAASSKAQAGMTLAMRDHQAAPGGEDKLREIQKTDYEPFFSLARKDDFIGVQSYSRILVGPEGELPAVAAAEHTESGSEFYPQALENTIRYAAKQSGRPVYVTENGIPTKDDAQRIRYIDGALAGVRRCLIDKIDLRGYFHWSAFDSYEWVYGYKHSYGLIAVDQTTFERTPKKSAIYLGNISRTGI